jgi:hypothetical protein
VSGSRGSRPAVQGPYRLSGSARLPGASPGSGVPSVLSGADLGPVLRLAGSSPGCGSDQRSTRLERSARNPLEALGRQPSLVAPKRGTRDQRRRGARCGRPTRGRPACLLSPGLAAGADRASRPLLLLKRTRNAKASTRARHGLRGFGASAARRDGASQGRMTMGTDDRNWKPVLPGAADTGEALEANAPEPFDDEDDEGDGDGESLGAWWARLPDFIKPRYPFDLPPERLPFATMIFTECGAPARCPHDGCRRSMECGGGEGRHASAPTGSRSIRCCSCPTWPSSDLRPMRKPAMPCADRGTPTAGHLTTARRLADAAEPAGAAAAGWLSRPGTVPRVAPTAPRDRDMPP